ncbi:carbonic anhydrase family protein [Acinetobacter sp. B5B]|uniref:carbonic anhydrase n=1 Tax=Acinetobacter baretiae TaxID=2605383 RepID=UPI0018C2D423|nr:carbonic anhydrase family protein [Acinetobacter baretiae]MBF7683274.1 carbonic anhydrase family protein [Acinetobacter baretiae]
MRNFLLGCFAFALNLPVMASESIHWGYDEQISPEHWGHLSDQFKSCDTGKNQTPINIQNTYKSQAIHQLNIQYKTSPNDIIFNGHTVQINTKTNDHHDYIVIDHDQFFLKQFHFHTPSENQIYGKQYPLELHFVHANKKGELAVLAVMFNLGKPNSELSKLWKDLSPEENKEKTFSQRINIEKLIPRNHGYYRFSGSLTTPPCTEGIVWIVLKQPLTLSPQQLTTFKSRLLHQHNQRPIQPLNGRIIIED